MAGFSMPNMNASVGGTTEHKLGIRTKRRFQWNLPIVNMPLKYLKIN